mgnify:CR=1 FL=1
MWTEKPMLTIESLSLEYPAIITRIIIILMKHIAWPYPIDAFLTLFDRQSLVEVLAEDEYFVVFGHLF